MYGVDIMCIKLITYLSSTFITTLIFIFITVKLYCHKRVEASPHVAVISCISERMLTEVLCSLNDSPLEPCMSCLSGIELGVAL